MPQQLDSSDLLPTAPVDPIQSYRAKVAQLKSRLLPAKSVLIVAHDYPDPDCIAAAYGTMELMRHWGVENAVITFGGFVGRAQNRAMIRFLNIESVPFPLIEPTDFDRIIMVDCFPGRGNVSMNEDIEVDAVLDHHLDSAPIDAPFFSDIRKDLGATSTLVTRYLIESGVPISPRLATALFYGIKTDTRDLGRDHLTEDLESYRMLFNLMDYKLLSAIENPDRDIEFFRLLHSAAESVICYDTIGYIHLGTISSPDYVAEMADFFHRLDRIEYMICSAKFKKSIYYSIRTKQEFTAGPSAEQIGRMLGGSGGGHGKIGAGRIPLNAQTAEEGLDSFIAAFKEILSIGDIEPEHILTR